MIPRRSPLLAALAGCSVLTFGAPILAPASLGLVRSAHAQQPAEFEQILAAYGTFQQHARYGQVWIPANEVAPVGWRPYPHCNWVYDRKLGWFYDDKTTWGKIVHHYGRWAHDETLGWVWVKGEEFSPAWVVWRTSDTWAGWAPLPPEIDLKEVSASAFNTDKHWTFVEAQKLGSRCDAGQTIVTAAPAVYPTLFAETRLVTEVRFVSGIVVFVLPPPLIVPIVDIDIGVFPPWSPCFFGAWFWHRNAFVTNIVVVVNPPAHCPLAVPVSKSMPMPIISTPPPPPGPGARPPRRPGQQTELPPRLDPPRLIDPPRLVPPPRSPDRQVELPPRLDPPRLIDPPRLVPPPRSPDRQVELPPRLDPPRLFDPPRFVPPLRRPDRQVELPPRLDPPRLVPPARPPVVVVPPRLTPPLRQPGPNLATPNLRQPQQPPRLIAPLRPMPQMGLVAPPRLALSPTGRRPVPTIASTPDRRSPTLR
jgi:hypothetical protein